MGIVLDGGYGSFLVCLVVLEWVGWLGNGGLYCTIGVGALVLRVVVEMRMRVEGGVVKGVSSWIG